MALNFPSSPTNGQLYTSTTGVTYQYNGTYWNAINTSYATGGFRKIDNISSQFNGSNTTFYLNVSGIPTTAVNAQNLIISIGGITQEPGNAYTVSANTITFTTAPSSGMSFFGTLLGDVANIGIASDKTVGLSTLTDSFGSFVTSSYAQANNAYNTANTKFDSSGGIITGPVQIASSLIVTGNVTMSGNVTTINANNLSLQDNMFYLNSGSNVANPDLGFAGNYNDGVYRHAGFFRDATDGYWKVFDSYLPEPDASPYIDTSNSSFKLATFQANNIFVANNVGIGTTSPSFPLEIAGPVANIRLAPSINTNSALLRLTNTGGSAYVGLDNSVGGLTVPYSLNLYHGGAYPITFSTSGTERMRIDASGNFGLAVTPSAWVSSLKAVQVGGNASVWSDASTGGWSRFSHNVYYDGTAYKRIFTGYSEKLRLDNNGAFSFQLGGTGSAGSTITFNQAMTLDASGNLGIGKTPADGYKLDISSSFIMRDGTFYIPHTGPSGGGIGTAVRQLKFGSYGRIQHTSLGNIAIISFNAGLTNSDFVGSGTGTLINTNVFTPDYAPGAFGIISPSNGGVAFFTGSWNNAANIDLGGLATSSAYYAGGFNASQILEVSKGVKFPATQVSSADANTLDDYEEGTYTPTLLTVTGTPTYLYQEAYYTKIGRQITCGGIIGISNSTSLTGTISISLPFPAKSSVYGQTGGCVSDAAGFTLPVAGSVYSITFQINNGSSYAIAQCLGTGTTSVAYNSTNVAATWYMRFMVTYPTTT